MSLISSIIEKLPGYIPKSSIIVEEEYTFGSNNSSLKTVYQLDKAPFYNIRSVTATVSGRTVEMDIDDDVESRAVYTDGYPDSVAFINQDKIPDDDTTFIVEYEVEPMIVRYIDSIDSELDSISDDIDGVIASKYIETCPGDKLDMLGASFGTVGRRLGRNNEEYRSFLRSVVRTFNANGTKSDIKFAVSLAVRGSQQNIRIEEDFERVGFYVHIDPTEDATITPSLNDLIDLARPSGVELLSSPVIQPEPAYIGAKSGSVEIDRDYGLGRSHIDDGDELE